MSCQGKKPKLYNFILKDFIVLIILEKKQIMLVQTKVNEEVLCVQFIPIAIKHVSFVGNTF